MQLGNASYFQLDSLEYIHSGTEAYVHTDIKAANLLLGLHSVYIYTSQSMSVSLSLSISLRLCLYLSDYVYNSQTMSITQSMSLSLYLSVYFYISQSMSVFLSLCLYLSVYFLFRIIIHFLWFSNDLCASITKDCDLSKLIRCIEYSCGELL